MNLKEYEKVKHFTYLEYCDYLQEKYGIGLCDYMTINWNKNRKVTRTKDGLIAHHKYENQAKLLSHPEQAKNHPFEWQQKENIVYCDFLEHLFLHILICEKNPEKTDFNKILGFGGVVEFIVPELNDVYSGWTSKEKWKNKCHNAIINDIDVYIKLIKRFKTYYNNDAFVVKLLCRSRNERSGWSKENNSKIFEEIINL